MTTTQRTAETARRVDHALYLMARLTATASKRCRSDEAAVARLASTNPGIFRA